MIIPLGETATVQWVDNGQVYDLDSLVLNGTTIWIRTIDFTASVDYSPITKQVTYSISGSRIGLATKWSVQGTRREDNLEGEELFVTDGSSSLSIVAGSDLDGTWDVVFKLYIGDDVRGQGTDYVTIATPSIEIVSIEPITPDSLVLLENMDYLITEEGEFVEIETEENYG